VSNESESGDHNRSLIDVLMMAVVALMILTAGVSVAAWKASDRASDAADDAAKATEDVKRVEKLDRDVQRATAYRLCSRNAADRAFAHASIRQLPVKGGPPPQQLSPDERESRRAVSRLLMDDSFLPILDCSPNLEGKGAKPLSIPKQEKYMHNWRLNRLTGAERGVCPDSTFGKVPSLGGC
jgi:hypothetical protein